MSLCSVGTSWPVLAVFSPHDSVTVGSSALLYRLGFGVYRVEIMMKSFLLIIYYLIIT